MDRTHRPHDGAGVLVRWFRPLRHRVRALNHRTHRKVLVVDEAMAVHRRRRHRRRVEGRRPQRARMARHPLPCRGPGGRRPAGRVPRQLGRDRLELFDDGVDRFPEQPKPGDPSCSACDGASETGWSDVATLFRTLLQLARECVRITTAYFVPDEEIDRRLCDAADRGVEVRSFSPGPHTDKRFVQLAGEAATTEPLLEPACESVSFQPSMLHAKIMTIDGVGANIGSANLNVVRPERLRRRSQSRGLRP